MITTPELFAYKIDPELWSKKMIAPGTRDKQWDLVVENIGPEIYTFPLFTKEFCDMVNGLRLYISSTLLLIYY